MTGPTASQAGAPDQVPQSAPVGQSSQIPSINDILQVAGVIPSQPLPPSTQQEHQSNPKLPRVSTQPNPQQRQPLTSSVYDIKHARRMNAFAGAIGAIQNVTKEVQQKHQDDVAHDVTTILNAQHQIDSANRIVNDPNANAQDKKNAQATLEANTSAMNRVFGDPKRRKNMEKAFDVSFTDPSKNDTPEVKAMMQGQKQFQQSLQSGLNVNNDAEKRTQELANGGQKDSIQSAHDSGLKVRGVDQPRALNTYADQFLKSQPVGLGANPQYAEAVKQQEQAQKAAAVLAKDVITQTGENERANLNAQQRDLANQRTEQARVQAAQVMAKSRVTAASIQASGAYKRTMDAVKLREDLAVKKEQSPAVQQKLMLDNLKILQDGKAKADKSVTDYETEKSVLRTNKQLAPGTEEDYDDLINAAKSHSREYSDMIRDTNLRLSNLGYRGALSNGSINSSGGFTPTKQEVVTDGNSLGSDEEPDENPDSYNTGP